MEKEKKSLLKDLIICCSIFVVIFVIDIVTKWAVFNYYTKTIGLSEIIKDKGTLPENQIKALPGFLHIGCILNKGAAWSLGTTEKYDGVNPILIVISVVLTGALIFYLVKEFKKLKTSLKVGLSLMIAGAFGNMIDRIFYRTSITGFKGVIDWIFVAFMDFPTFNIADSALVIGVFVLIVVFIIDLVKEAKEKASKGEYKYSPNELKEMKQNETNKGK